MSCGRKTCSSTVLPLPGVNASGAISVLNLVRNLDGLEAHFLKKKSPAKLIYKKLCEKKKKRNYVQIKFVFVKVPNGEILPRFKKKFPFPPPFPSLTELGPWCYRTTEFTDSLVFCEGKGVPSIPLLLVSPLPRHGRSLVLGFTSPVTGRWMP